MVSSKRLLAVLAACVFGTGLAGASQAALYGPFTDSIGLSATGWSSTVSVPKFDPSLGTLNSIKLTLAGHVEGTAKFESLDADPATVTMSLSASLTLQRPDLSTLVVTIPVANTTDNVTAWDLVTDFGGTSGKTYTNLLADSSNSVT
ncbi:MAG: choice-of-anchor E domain-containing protein, partial [Tepidisphaeraceae bacterium]